ncbi:hypothetical protein BH10ACT1_BH10ACT1_17020 [soil metagenome]
MSTDQITADPTARADRFLAELSDVKHDGSNRNATFAKLGAVMLAAGVILAVVGVVLSQSTDNPLDQSTDVSLGLAGVALAIAGLGVFLRYSLAQFLRFWLLRLIYEQAGQPAARPSDVA